MPREKELYRDNLEIFTRRALEQFPNKCIFTQKEAAELLGVKQNDFVKWLIDHKYIYRDKRGRLMPYAEHVDSGLFEIKETYNEKTDWTGVQTLVTVKGKERFLKTFS